MHLEFIFIGAFVGACFLVSYLDNLERAGRIERRWREEQRRLLEDARIKAYEEAEARKLRTEYR